MWSHQQHLLFTATSCYWALTLAPSLCLNMSAASAAGLPDSLCPQDACAGQSASSSSPPGSLALVLGTLGALPCPAAASLPATGTDTPDFCGCSWGPSAEPVSGCPACQKEKSGATRASSRHAALVSKVQAEGVASHWQIISLEGCPAGTDAGSDTSLQGMQPLATFVSGASKVHASRNTPLWLAP